MIAFVLSIVLIFFNLGHGIPYKMLSIALVCALIIVFAQYPILCKSKNWYLKTLVFFLSMNIFLLLYGEALCFADDCIGDFPGLKMIVFGNIMGAGIGFIVVIAVNYIFRKDLF
ncbi:hypothetical protein [Dysgonomonas massiliensis]|uniref:hypothetical protein n=1 Tax=Dysgonomonas massiliensis TaxID=2040292 RepID=UPI001359BCE0|nr:hypothetical protein [Dysgonomonas massiliensis]